MALVCGKDAAQTFGWAIHRALWAVFGGMNDTDHPLGQFTAGFLCAFGRGTRLLTSEGDMPVEDVQPGEAVLDPDGRPHFVLWQGPLDLLPGMARRGALRPGVKIAANAFGPGKPRRALILSQEHRVLVEAQEEGRLVRAGDLAPLKTRVEMKAKAACFHAVVTAAPCLLMAENLGCESLDPEIWPVLRAEHDLRQAVAPWQTGGWQAEVLLG